MISPSISRIIWSYSSTAAIFCVTETNVSRGKFRCIFSRIFFSVLLSTREVKSSSNNIVGLRASARASMMRCFCPPERLEPRSETTVLNLSGNVLIKSFNSAVSIAFCNDSSVTVSLNAIFSRMLMLKIILSWKTKPTCL